MTGGANGARLHLSLSPSPLRHFRLFGIIHCLIYGQDPRRGPHVSWPPYAKTACVNLTFCLCRLEGFYFFVGFCLVGWWFKGCWFSIVILWVSHSFYEQNKEKLVVRRFEDAGDHISWNVKNNCTPSYKKNCVAICKGIKLRNFVIFYCRKLNLGYFLFLYDISEICFIVFW